jgi:broad specificity phosphatase PhoE
MALVILVRHGETTSNRDRHFGVSEDVQLTELGEQQARELAQRLAQEFSGRFRPQRILSSKYARARRTSEILAERLGLEVEVVQGIHERDFGYLKGLTYDHIPPVANTDPDWVPEGGESRRELQARVLTALHAALTRYTEEEILVVCHGAVIQSICAHLAGSWENAHMPDNCGMVAVRYEDGKLAALEVIG